MTLPTFKLLLLGRYRLTGPDGPVDLSSKKLAALLAYLAFTSPVPQSREKLATLLWGSYFDTQARQNLRQALFRLRRTLGDEALISDGDDIVLAPGMIDCDAARFDALIRDGGQNSCRDAIGLYQGRLLADVAIAEEGWGDWVTAERQRLEGLALDALVRFGEIELALNHADKALKIAHRALAINNLREDAHRLVIKALAGGGRKAEAHKHYQGLVALLRRELNTEPDAATKALAAELGSKQPSKSTTGIENKWPTLPKLDQLSAAATPASERRKDPQVAVTAATPQLQTHAPSPVAAVHSGSSERRQLTVMVCNLVGSTDLSAGHDPEDVQERIAAFHRRVTELVAQFGGLVAQYLGDGAHVYFGYPAAHEDDAEQAVRAALAIREASGPPTGTSPAALWVRIGIATGLVVVDDKLGTGAPLHRVAIGETPNVAVLLQAVAAPGEVIIAKSTRQLVGRLFDCQVFGADETKTLRQPIEAWLVRGERAGVSRFEARRAGTLSPLVGRQEEIELLLRRWAQVKAGEGRVVLVSGEPGIGKSRLTQEFKRCIAADRHLWIECGGAAFLANIPFHAVAQMLTQGLGWRGREPVEERYAKLAQSLGLTGMKLAEAVPLIAELLGLPVDTKYPPLMFSADQRRKRLLAALTEWVFSVTRRQPLIIVVEDLHWIDPSTLELLQTLAEQCVGARLLLLSTARPELRAPWPMRAHHAQIILNRLNNSETRQLVAGMTTNARLTHDLVDAVIDRADGVPLFVEELTRPVLEGKENGREIPVTLIDSLTARLDRLGPAKDVAQLGAVLGRDFSYELLAAVSRLPGGELDAALALLANTDLVYARGLARYSSYQFKHALVQDAAYQTLLKGRRRELHARVATTIEERFPALAGTQPQVLAHHWFEAGDAGRAFEAWVKAAKTARARHAFVEAGDAFRRARAILHALPETPDRDDQEQGLLAQFGSVLQSLEGNNGPEMVELIARYHALAERCGNLRGVIGLRFSIFVQAFMAGNWSQARVLADQLTEFVEHVRQGPQSNLAPTGVRLANYAQFITQYYNRGNITRAEQHFAAWQASPSDGSEESKRIDRLSPALAQAALCAWHVDRPDLARGRLAEAMAHATNSEDHWSLAFAHMQDALLHVFEGNPCKVEAAATRALATAKEKAFVQIEGLTLPCLGWAYTHLGRSEEGLAHISKGISMLSAIGSRVSLPFFITLRAESEALNGAFDAAFATFDEALTLNPEEQLYQPHTLISRGDVHFKLGQNADAEADFHSALALARQNGAIACERRALIGLAQTMQARGVVAVALSDR